MLRWTLSRAVLTAATAFVSAGCAGPRERASTGLETTSIDKAVHDVTSIREAANLFRIQHLRAPTLQDLTTPAASGEVLVADQKDPWGHDYILRADEKGRPIVICVGPDGIEGTEDDIVPRQQRARDQAASVTQAIPWRAAVRV